MRILIFKSIFLILISAIHSIAQQQDTWITFKTTDGLASNRVWVIFESRDGALWFGTDGGISKYDYFKEEWTTFTENDTGLVNNHARAIIQDKDGALWFGTDGGINRYYNGIWTTFTIDDGLANNQVWAIIQDKDGALWFGTDGGVSKYHEGNWKTFTKDSGLVNNHVRAIIQDKDGYLWFGTQSGLRGGGVSRFKEDEGIWETYNTDIADGLVCDFINAITETSDGTLWFGTVQGISKYDGDFRKFRLPDELSNKSFKAIIEAKDGALWFGTDGGVTKYDYDKEEGTTFTITDGLADNQVNAISQSGDGAVWFGTNEGGVSRFQERVLTIFKTADGLAHNHINVIIEASDSALWFGTKGGVSRYYEDEDDWETFTDVDGLIDNDVEVIFEANNDTLWFGTRGGVSRYQEKKWQPFITIYSLAHKRIKVIIESNNGALWFGTEEGGVSRYIEKTCTTFTEAEGLVCDYITVIIESSDSTLWFGTRKGVSKYDGETFKEFSLPDELADSSVTAITEAKDGALWFGTPRGVAKYDGERDTCETFTKANGLSDNYVRAIIEAKDGALWFGTHRGVSRYDGENWRTFTEANGLSNNSVLAIIEAKDGAMWFGTESGGVGRHQEGDWTIFTTADGLPSNKVKTIIESNDDVVWLGTPKGAIGIKPDNFPPTTYLINDLPKIVATSTPMFIFRAKDDRTPIDQLKYSYMILDTNNVSLDGDPSIFFQETAVEASPLNNGTYTFYVRAKDKWGNVDPTPDSINFTVDITPPTTVINYPAQNDTLSQLKRIPVIGYAYDDSPIKDFNYYGIYYGKGKTEKNVADWDSLTPQDNKKEIRNDTLAIWNTVGLRGTYQLKLFAYDTLGHQSQDIITVHIVDVTEEIKNRQGGCVADCDSTIELCFPPNSFEDNVVIKISRVTDLEPVQINNERYKYAGLAYEIMPKNIIAKKTGTLTITYADLNLTYLEDEKKLSIFKYIEKEDDWDLIGGTIQTENNKISTSIKKLGSYGLFENLIPGTKLSLSDLDCQPRLFSPRGGGYSIETNISFYLGKDSDVTIKIFNLARRLVKTLCENKYFNSGSNSIPWNGKDSTGRFCQSGLYVVMIQVEREKAAKTVMVLNK